MLRRKTRRLPIRPNQNIDFPPRLLPSGNLGVDVPSRPLVAARSDQSHLVDEMRNVELIAGGKATSLGPDNAPIVWRPLPTFGAINDDRAVVCFRFRIEAGEGPIERR